MNKTRVQPERASELPTSEQLYFLLNRAKERGEQISEIPLRRDMAALNISLIKDKGQTYREALKGVRLAIALKR